MSPEVGTREMLEAELARTADRLRDLTADHARMVEASRDTNVDDEHDPEGTTIAYERSQLDAVIQQARDHVAGLDEAIQRLDDGTYGICEACDQPIATERLQAKPTARACVDCAH